MSTSGITPEAIEAAIKTKLEATHVELVDMSGTSSFSLLSSQKNALFFSEPFSLKDPRSTPDIFANALNRRMRPNVRSNNSVTTVCGKEDATKA